MGKLEAEVNHQVELLSQRAAMLVTEEELRAKIRRSLEKQQPLKVKLGVDPSAPDIHLGHIVVMRKLREFQELGHEIYFVIGDFTGMIGDPSGRSKTRRQLSREEVEANARTYHEQATLILDPDKTHVVFNSSWLSPLTFADLVTLASKFTVARMLERDDFHKRYTAGQAIGIHEFLYPLAQAYDSIAIGADVELGGTDQTFNLLVGRDLQPHYGQEPQIALTMPLLVGTDGKEKMSKSLGNYIGVTDNPNDMYGKVMSIPDEVMGDYFELILAEPKQSVKTMMRDIETGKRHPMDVKMELARRIVAEFHGLSAANTAQDNFLRVFREDALPDDIETVELENVRAGEEVGLARLIATCGLAPSSSEARRLIQSGAVRVNRERLTDPFGSVRVTDGMLIQVGKRRICRVSVK
ncbi:MAG: tyrosine--tRNA ligase [Bacillota bacterium]|nr:tyrosine--tRNA ligase [Candidatus Fermentithermobacillaceae bacterium]HAF66761.1 tyrosine--tRNA ligase [Clostridiales bacterium UBA9857]HOA70471.1 tyrosine--tRNA ligase [Bacillota bacterium]HOP71384.1 tyrosine--tRNA ligase [Bacillota bacterium]HPZ85290.1 tyrosine--tRNA ligase [Bacillota bacterium]